MTTRRGSSQFQLGMSASSMKTGAGSFASCPGLELFNSPMESLPISLIRNPAIAKARSILALCRYSHVGREVKTRLPIANIIFLYAAIIQQQSASVAAAPPNEMAH